MSGVASTPAAARPAIQFDPENSLERARIEGLLRRPCATERALCHQFLEGHPAQREDGISRAQSRRRDNRCSITSSQPPAFEGDFADYVIKEHARAAGCDEVATFDWALLKEPGFVAP